MQTTIKDISNTKKQVVISCSDEELSEIKKNTLSKLAKEVKAPGFRNCKAPSNIIEKNIDQQKLQSEFLDEAINLFYVKAIQDNNLKPISRPEINVTKFVPFNTLEFQAIIEVLGPVKLFSYKTLKKQLKNSSVSEAEVKEVLNNIATRQAKSSEVKRAAKNKDKVWIDFKGVDDKKQPVAGADGKDYPLVLGSKTFIPGFEENIIGLKKDDKKTFDTIFPKSYGVKKLAGKKVTFEVKVNKVEEVSTPKIDDKLAKEAGPFENLTQLKRDIKAQLLEQKNKQNIQDLEAEIIKEITEKSSVDIPDSLVQDQTDRILADFKRDLSYKGQTFKEYLEMQDKTEEEFVKKVVIPDAKQRVKAGLVLAEIADQEQIHVTPEELETRIQVMKSQYKDPATHAELDKPEVQHDIKSRLLTEKTITKVYELATT